MRKEVLLVVSLLLMIFMVGSVRANKVFYQSLGIDSVDLDIDTLNCLSLITEIDNSVQFEIDKICYSLREHTSTGVYNEIVNGFLLDNGIILTIEGKNYSSQLNDFPIFAVYNGGDIDNLRANSKTIGTITLVANDGSAFIGSFDIRFQNDTEFPGDIQIGGIIIEDNEQRISALESWQQTIDDWKETISNIISEFTLSIIGLVTKTNDYETRISDLENQNFSQPNITISDYWKYMSSSDRKNIVCGVTIDNHLTTLTMQELGYRCDVTYRQTSKGEKASCRCSRL